jgi:hypothetical protein
MAFVAANQPCHRQHYQQLRKQRAEARLTQSTEVPQYLKDMVKLNREGTIHAEPKFVPHIHHAIYYKDYVRCYGQEKADELKRLHEEWENQNPPEPPPPQKWKPQPENYNHPAIQKLHEDYYKHQKRPPIDARLRAHKEAGYPESWLIQMLKKHEEAVRKQPEVDEWFDRVMGPYGKKKESVPKPRTLTQIFKIKALKVVMPDDDDEE